MSRLNDALGRYLVEGRDVVARLRAAADALPADERAAGPRLKAALAALRRVTGRDQRPAEVLRRAADRLERRLDELWPLLGHDDAMIRAGLAALPPGWGQAAAGLASFAPRGGDDRSNGSLPRGFEDCLRDLGLWLEHSARVVPGQRLPRYLVLERDLEPHGDWYAVRAGELAIGVREDGDGRLLIATQSLGTFFLPPDWPFRWADEEPGAATP